MIIVVDFDGTVIEPQAEPGEPSEKFILRRGALEALYSLKRASHVLVLFSSRANMAHRIDWRLNPLWANGIVPFDEATWEAGRQYWEEAFQQMVRFVDRELPGLFDAVDGGMQGKPIADLYLDDKAFRMGLRGWRDVAMMYGDSTTMFGAESRGRG